MNWVLKFCLICFGAIFAMVPVVWAVGNATEGVSTGGIIALILGVVVTVGLAVGLMALTFVRGHQAGEDVPRRG